MKYVTLWGGCEPGFQFDCELIQWAGNCAVYLYVPTHRGTVAFPASAKT